ncbi:protocadherin-9-like [Gigantopelta aegis]|uniref:protocadherin-9-like n=1 Tax=Gigantopelta aegis TaxID=1735272 RepID=UPI001B889326|nr:protocadherin-9-like [Gigantopelta aegis]
MASVLYLAIFYSHYVLLTMGENASLTYHLIEEQPVGTFIGNVAIDSKLYSTFSQDELDNLKYAIFTQTNHIAQKFSIDESKGTIKTAEVLDREVECEFEVNCRLSFDVGVYFKDTVTNTYDLNKIIRVHNILEDINDNAPYFPHSEVTLSVPESVSINHVLLTSGAIDLDTGPNNSVQIYDLQPKDSFFDLKVISNPDGSSDLGIVVKHLLDREEQNMFQVVILARDGGTEAKSGTVTINIEVTDVNDNRPVFNKSVFNITVFEDIPIGKQILKLSASDADNNLNGKISFHFSSRTSEKVKRLFHINETSGELYSLKYLDFEHDRKYQFLVEVKDFGSPSLSSQASVTVNVADANDNAPQIIVSLPNTGREVSENAALDTFIVHVSVSDADSGRNGEVSCNISDNHFKLVKFSDFNYYKILIQKELDYERLHIHNITIMCKDSGEKPLYNSSHFLVRVLDINDNAPMFVSDVLTGHVMENNKIGDLVMTLSALDLDGDENNNIIYQIASDNASQFTLDQFTGQISALTVFDHEMISYFEFIITASDSGTPSLTSTATVVVTVSDQNDNPPKFVVPHFYLSVIENQPSYVIVGKLNATDRDSVDNFRFSFYKSSDMVKYFTIDALTGLMKTTQSLSSVVQSDYHFRVIVTDPEVPSFSDVANVTVHVTKDINNPPSITFPNNDTIYVPFDRSVGSVITVMRAVDDDKSPTATLTFTIEQGNYNNLFFMSLTSGELVIGREMTSDDVGTYKLVLAAHDSGIPPHSSYAVLYVTVTMEPMSTEYNQNVMIVITLVCVTIAVSLAILLAICLMKKVDSEKEKCLRGKDGTDTMYTADDAEKALTPPDECISDLYKEKPQKPEDSDLYKDLSQTRDANMLTPEKNGSNIFVKPNMLTDVKTSNTKLCYSPRKLVQFADEVMFTRDDSLDDVHSETDSGQGGSDIMVQHSDSVVSSASYV